MYRAYPKRDVWLIIYEFVASAWAELPIDGIPPPEPPCSDVWSMLSDNHKEEAWTLLLEWLEHYNIVELLDALSDADWCRGHGQYVKEPTSHNTQSLPVWERSSALLLNSGSADFWTLILLARATTCLSAQ